MTSARDTIEPDGARHGPDGQARRGAAHATARVLPLSRGASRPRHLDNLPHASTRFVGRAVELAQLRDWTAATRLLTLAGPGGTGKTRLALELARAALPISAPAPRSTPVLTRTVTHEPVRRFPDGVWLVELAPLDRPYHVPQAVAAVLGVHDPAGRSPPDILVTAIGQRQLLLLLDNCEHLIDATAQLAADLLAACPGLAIIATSREPLAIDGETIWRVPGLALPAGLRPEKIATAEAVALFLDRARTRRPDLTITDENASAIVQICRRLDGLPLALELAAARTDALTPAEIAARLDERFDLLTGGSRVALPRHRTLRSLVDWSYTLLSPADQAVFRRLAVFTGGWMLEAAEAVAMDRPTDSPPVTSASARPGPSCGGPVDIPAGALDPLARLTARSLVQAEPHQGQTRYRLLETLRAYGLQLLDASGELDEIRQRHATYYLQLLERPRPREGGETLHHDLDRLECEHDNLRAALAWFRDRGLIEAGLRLATRLWWFWSVRGYLGEGRAWLRTFLEHAVAPPSAMLRVRALYGSGVLARLQGDLTGAHALQHEALTIARALGDDRGAAEALTELGDIADSRGAFNDARRLMAAAIAIWRRLAYDRDLAGCLARLARIALRQGDTAVVLPLLQESQQLARLIGATDILAACHFYLGERAASLADRDGAAGQYRQSLLLFQEQGYQRWIARLLESLASLDADSAPDRALHFARAASHLRQSSGQPLTPSERERLLARLAPAMAALGAGFDPTADATVVRVDAAIQEALTPDEAQPAPAPAGQSESASPSTTVPAAAEPADGMCSGVPLTRREWDVIELLARGYSNPQISESLVVSRRTVEAHVTAILNKLGLSSRTQVAVWAVERGRHAR